MKAEPGGGVDETDVTLSEDQRGSNPPPPNHPDVWVSDLCGPSNHP